MRKPSPHDHGTPDGPVVRTIAATRVYQEGPHGVRGVCDFDLSVAPGEIVGLSGRSGSGKSTALRLVSAIERPDSGRVEFGGRDVWAGVRGSSPQLPRTGYVMPVFQDPTSSLDPRWAIYRSVTEPMTVHRRLSRAERVAAARTMLEGVGLDHVDVHALPSQLSGGQCQRVAIVRALSGGPALLVADEPTASLDVTSAAGIMHLLRRTADAGTAIVVVSHDQRVLETLADRILRLENGQVVQADQPDQPDRLLSN